MVYQNIKAIAKSKKIPISKIEEACNVTPRYMCKWDRITPNPKTLASVASYLGTTVEELVKE